ncbi:DUF4435 domain-containing protein [Chloroflexota bacterium]
MTPERTTSGKINKYLFSPEILIWVEGIDDIPFYVNGLERGTCKFLPAGGKEEIKKLINALVKENLPYVVILDGDYEVLENPKSINSRIINLRRYSIENYLLEEELIEAVCRDYLCIKTGNELEVIENLDVLCSQIKKTLTS